MTTIAKLSSSGNLNVTEINEVTGSNLSVQHDKVVVSYVNENVNLAGTTKMKKTSTELRIKGTLTATGNANLVNTTVTGNLNITGTSNLMPIGGIVLWTQFEGTIPNNFVLCDGTSYDTTAKAALHAVIGYTYGGGGANFNVPNMVGKQPMGKAASGVGVNLADTGGSLDHTHTTNHLHTVNNHSHTLDTHTHTMSSHTHTYDNAHTHTTSAHRHELANHRHDDCTHGHSYNEYDFGGGATAAIRGGADSFAAPGHKHYSGGYTSSNNFSTGYKGSGVNTSDSSNNSSAGSNNITTTNNGSTDGSFGTITGPSNNNTISNNAATGANNSPYMALMFIMRYA